MVSHLTAQYVTKSKSKSKSKSKVCWHAVEGGVDVRWSMAESGSKRRWVAAGGEYRVVVSVPCTNTVWVVVSF